MNCSSSCLYYRAEIKDYVGKDFYDNDKYHITKDYCLLAHKKCELLTFCPNRDGIAPSDVLTCESCGKRVPLNESFFRRYDALISRWYGECSTCAGERRRKDLLLHLCEKNCNRYGVCTVCGIVLPGTPLDKF